MTEPIRDLLWEVQDVIAPFGCVAIALGPSSVGVQGDTRVVGPSVYITVPPDTSYEQVTRISNEITNKVPGITRVLMDITAIKLQLH